VREYPEVEAYGSGELREKNFIDTLELLKSYEAIADRVARGRPLDLEQRLDYLEANGVQLYRRVLGSRNSRRRGCSLELGRALRVGAAPEKQQAWQEV